VSGATTSDALLGGRLTLTQPARGARVTMDPLLLLGFALPAKGALLDLGCGTGVLAVGASVLEPRVRAVGVELDPTLAALCRDNAAGNGVAVDVREGDLRQPRKLGLAAQSFALVLANPPYFADSGRGGGARANARQERTGTLADFVACARRFTAPRGRFALTYPAERLAEVLSLLGGGLAARRLRAVHSVADEPARRVLVEAQAGWRGGVTVMPPLVVHQADRKRYTPEAAALLGI
jgi:tRNA1Val (adenine37-N6)-methyltransferase